MTIFQRWKQTALHNKALVLTGVIVALGTVVSTGVLIAQIYITEQNNKATGQQIQKLIDAANIQGNAATKISQAADSFSNSTDAIESQTIAAVGQLKRTADDSERAISEASKNAEQALHLGERPYLTVADMKFEPALDQNQKSAMLKIVVHNSGRTPALKQLENFKMFVDEREQPTYAPNFPGESVIASDKDVTIELVANFAEDDLAHITRGTARMVIKGPMSYQDIFKQLHATTVCAVYDSVERNWKFCNGNNVE